jgi:hypothetical protein
MRYITDKRLTKKVCNMLDGTAAVEIRKLSSLDSESRQDLVADLDAP